MTGPAFQRLLDALTSSGIQYRETEPGKARSVCPLHGDNPSNLAITDGYSRVLLWCHSRECDPRDIASAVGLGVADLYHQAETRYDYADRTVVRSYPEGEREFRQRGAIKGKPSTLYRLDRLAGAKVVYLAEGEEDVHALESLGVVATTAPQGGANFEKVDAEPLRGKRIVAIPDQDEVGQKWAQQVQERLSGVAAGVEWRAPKVGKDPSDHVAAGYGIDDLVPTSGPDPWGNRPRPVNLALLPKVEPIRWFAKNRIPRGAVTLLTGAEGIGKSVFWVWIASAETTGKGRPEFAMAARDPGHVLVIATEDSQQEVRTRLDVAGADRSRVDLFVEPESWAAVPPEFPTDKERLYATTRPPTLVIVDAWLDTVPGGLQVRNPQEARLALALWQEYAAKTGAAVVLVTHTNRVSTGNARDTYGITGELRKKARSALYAQTDEEGYLLVGPEKSNSSELVTASRFRIAKVQYRESTDEIDGSVARLEYVGDSGRTVRELVTEKYEMDRDGETSEERTESERFILGYLQGDRVGGEASAGDVIKAGIAAGFTKDQIKHARHRCKAPRIISRPAAGGVRIWAVDVETMDQGAETPGQLAPTRVVGLASGQCRACGEPLTAPGFKAECRHLHHPAEVRT